MSENLDLVRSIYRAWELGDFSSADWADLEIEYVMAEGPAPGNWRGLAEMAKAWGDFLSAWEWYRVEVDRYCELDDQRVLVLVRFSARGKTSGLQLARMRTESATLFHVRDGKVTRLVVYWDREPALTHLGLEG